MDSEENEMWAEGDRGGRRGPGTAILIIRPQCCPGFSQTRPGFMFVKLCTDK